MGSVPAKIPLSADFTRERLIDLVGAAAIGCHRTGRSKLKAMAEFGNALTL
jgi:hypothetical protein